jgi:hypothetical protein
MSDLPLPESPFRFRPPWLAALIVPAIVWLGLLLMVAVRPEPQPKPLEYVTIGLAFGTYFGFALLAGAWVALGPLALLWRLPLSLAWLAAAIIALASNIALHGPRVDGQIVLVFGGVGFGLWLLTQFPLWGLAVGYGLRVRHLHESGPAYGRKEQQFGIRQLLIVTTIVAVVLAIGRAIAFSVSSRVSVETEGIVIISFVAIAGLIMTLPLILAALLPRHALPASIIVLVLVALGTSTELPLLTALNPAPGGPGPHVGHFFGINGFQCFWVLAVCGALRWSGYRLCAAK